MDVVFLLDGGLQLLFPTYRLFSRNTFLFVCNMMLKLLIFEMCGNIHFVIERNSSINTTTFIIIGDSTTRYGV